MSETIALPIHPPDHPIPGYRCFKLDRHGAWTETSHFLYCCKDVQYLMWDTNVFLRNRLHAEYWTNFLFFPEAWPPGEVERYLVEYVQTSLLP